MALKREPERLDNLVDECLEACLRDRAKDLTRTLPGITRHISPGIPEYSMDRDLIKEALASLIREAATRLAPPARLRVTVKANRNALMFAVKAPGAGLDEARREKLFAGEPVAGSLARVRLIIAAHGGVAWTNGLPGKGITYYFSLPIRQADVHHA